MPRPQSNVWQYFSRSDGNRRAICKYCLHEMASLVVRMKNHLVRKCPMCPEEVRVSLRESELPIMSSSKDKIDGKRRASSISYSRTNKKIKKNTDVVTVYKKVDMDRRVAKAIYGMGISISMLDSPAFHQLVKKLSNQYEIPATFHLAGQLLDREYQAVFDDVHRRVEASPSVCLSVESWSELRNRSIITYNVTTPDPGVLDIVDTGENLHTPQYLVECIEQVLDSIGFDKITALVTDTSSSMKLAWKELERKYPMIIVLGSCFQSVNSIVEEIFELGWASSLLELCKHVVETILEDHILHAALQRILMDRLGTLQDPLTRCEEGNWNTILDCMQCIQGNRGALQELYDEYADGLPHKLEPRLRRRFQDASFWDDLESFLDLISPLGEVLKVFETDRPMLSSFYHYFHLFMEHVEKDSVAPIASNVLSIVQTHWKTMEHPVMHAAHLFDPRYRATALTNYRITQVMDYLKKTTNAEVYPNLVSDITKYTAQSGLFGDEGIWESAELCGPIEWWRGFIGSTCPHLQTIAIRTLAIPASPSISQSKIDTFDDIRRINKMHLDSKRAMKAAYIYWNMNLTAEKVLEGHNVSVV